MELAQQEPLFVPSRNSVRKAGELLRCADSSPDDFISAFETLSLWRNLHSFPIKTFRTYLEQHLKRNNFDSYIIAQRLKRLPSIIAKLQRFHSMGLERMQDIGGIRVILKDNVELERLYEGMRKAKFGHIPILPPKDYIANPKEDGYRSLHQVYRYHKKYHPELNILHFEVQLRTQLQHDWATAVETLGIVERSSFKSGEGSDSFKQFFKLSSAIFSHIEKKPVVMEFKDVPYAELVNRLKILQEELRIFTKLESLAISAKQIELTSKNSDSYHLMTLNITKGTISLIPFQESQLEDAEALYRTKELETRDNPNISVILISAGNVKEIKKAYPNYFLDTNNFIKRLRKACLKK